MGTLAHETIANAAFPQIAADQKTKDDATAASVAEATRLQDAEKQRVEDERQQALAKYLPSFGFDRRRGLTSLLGSG